MSKPGAKLRAVAAQTVDAVVSDGQSLDAAIGKFERQVKPDDRALLRLLCFGVLRNHWRLQSWIDVLLSRPLKRRDQVVNALLAIGLYQLTDTRIPDHAAVSQTVEAARILRRPKLAGLLNACLRRFMREHLADAELTTEEARWNHPAWFIERLQNDWPDDWQAILAANDERAPMWLRVNRLRASAGEYRALLAEDDISSALLAGVTEAVRLETPVGVDALPGFRDGDVSVQDGAAQIAALWMSAASGERILDACAAPGGKTGHLLELIPDAQLTALELDPDRVHFIEENLTRIGLDATILAADASNPKEWWDGRPFDRILLDAPCSASGVIRRHPDIKMLRRESDIDALAATQGALLRSLWPLLKPGGQLLYVTCSVVAAENDKMIGQFLRDQDDAIENDVLPNNNIRDLMRKKACGYQILPGTADLDGFYYASLRRKKVS